MRFNDPLDILGGEDKKGAAPAAPAAAGGLTMPWATVISNLATAGVDAYEAHEQSAASQRQAKLQETAQQGDKGLRDYALEMRKKANDARAKADQYRQATAGKGMAFGAAYKNLDDTARTLDKAASDAEERAGLRPASPSPAALAAAMQAQAPAHKSSFFAKNATVLIGGAAVVAVGGVLYMFLRRRK